MNPALTPLDLAITGLRFGGRPEFVFPKSGEEAGGYAKALGSSFHRPVHLTNGCSTAMCGKPTSDGMMGKNLGGAQRYLSP